MSIPNTFSLIPDGDMNQHDQETYSEILFDFLDNSKKTEQLPDEIIQPTRRAMSFPVANFISDIVVPSSMFEKLSRELVFHIFQMMTSLQDILNMRLVCKMWSRWLICNCNWRKFAWDLMQYWYDWNQELAPLGTNLFYDTISVLRKMRSPAGKDLKEQDMYLPKENIKKVMKKILPQGAKVSKEALECMQECTTEFILFVLGEAADITMAKKKKTVGSDFIIEAMNNLSLDNYGNVMATYLEKYKKAMPKPKKRTHEEIDQQDEVDA